MRGAARKGGPYRDFVFGLATYSYAADDQTGRRLAAVQLVLNKIASATDVASAFAVSQATVWRWVGALRCGGVGALVSERTGPRGPSKLTAELTAQVLTLNASGLSLRKIAEQVGVSPGTVRAALGRVRMPARSSAEPAIIDDDVEILPGDDVAEQDNESDGIADTQTDPVTGTDLVPLAVPLARTAERAAARFGDLVEAPVVITQGSGLPLAGLLLALPGLAMTGLLTVAAEVFPPMRKGFYGLRATLLMAFFMALAREPRAEGATRLRPGDLGRLLGLDRAPEVKTLRRKLAELASHARGAQLQGALGKHHATNRPDAVGFLYLDGHVRVYTGTRQLPKTHIARMRIAGPATEETWVGDAHGDPVMVLTAAPSQSLASELRRHYRICGH